MERSFSFTLRGGHLFMDTVNDLLFPDLDAQMIFQVLKDRFYVVPFYRYLQRYIYLKSGMVGSFTEVSFESYYTTLLDAFRESGTPASLHRGSARVSSRAREWLQQTTARRNLVLLLGFGLSMSKEDVNAFLTRAIHDHLLDEENPLECICAYCYQNHYSFSKMEQLWKIYQETEGNCLDAGRVEMLQPAFRPESRLLIEQDTRLLRELLRRRGQDGFTAMRRKTNETFQMLYQQVCEILGKLGRSSDTPIQPHDVENIMCAAIPRDRHGNLIPELNSALREEMAGKRMSRQHLYELLRGILEPTRFDLITLRFLIACLSQEKEQEPRQRYQTFVSSMNQILLDCSYGELYTASPYECFIMMCLLSIDPLATYTDVFELSYGSEKDRKEPQA